MKIEFEDGLHPWKYTSIDGEIVREKNLDVYITISKRIKDYYDTTKHSVIFTYGNMHLIENIIEADTNTKVIAYLDLPVDNLDIVGKWCELLEEIVVRQASKVLLVPIPCIEYCVCKMEGVNFCDMGLYRQGKFYENNVSKHGVTYEKYCKAVFSTIADKFPKEVRVEDWIIDKEKSKNIVNSLPVYVVSDEENGYMKFDEARLRVADTLFKYVQQLRLYVDNKYVNERMGTSALANFEGHVKEYRYFIQKSMNV